MAAPKKPIATPKKAAAPKKFVDDTYVKVNGVWRYVYRAVEHHGQVIDVLVSARGDAAAARRFFRRTLDELVPSAWHHVERYANNPIEADHSQLKHRLRPMRGLRSDRTTQTIITGHAFMQNPRRGHYELGLDAPRGLHVAVAFTELASAI